MCGPSSDMKADAAQQHALGLSSKAFSDTLTNDFSQVFSKNQNILQSITGALTPIVNRGVNQYGFSPEEDAARRTQAAQLGAATARNVTNSVRGAAASSGGGNMYLPSGAEDSLNSQLAEQEAQAQNNAQLDITREGYATGRQNFFGAEQGLASAPGQLENPATSMGNAATNSLSEAGTQTGRAFEADTAIDKANHAWIAPVTGLAGAALQMIPGVGTVAKVAQTAGKLISGVVKSSSSSGGGSATGPYGSSFQD